MTEAYIVKYGERAKGTLVTVCVVVVVVTLSIVKTVNIATSP